MSDCIFCKIVQGEIPSKKVYEDSDFLGFIDIRPVSKGHVLLIPKEHYETFLDLPDKFHGPFSIALQNVAKAVVKATKAEGLNIGLNVNKAAGQEVFHVHYHVIPRFESDSLAQWARSTYDAGEDAEFAEKIGSFLKDE